MNKKKIWISVGVFVSLVVLIFAADYYRVNNGTSSVVNEHSVCQRVTNSNGNDLFVPTKTSGEWSNFRSNLPTGVSLSACHGKWSAGVEISSGSCGPSIPGDSGTQYSTSTLCTPHGTTNDYSQGESCSLGGSCSVYGNEVLCEETPGCYWTVKCLGTPTGGRSVTYRQTCTYNSNVGTWSSASNLGTTCTTSGSSGSAQTVGSLCETAGSSTHTYYVAGTSCVVSSGSCSEFNANQFLCEEEYVGQCTWTGSKCIGTYTQNGNNRATWRQTCDQ